MANEPQNVEDVLSSIRKMVNDEVNAGGAAPAPKPQDKLVLTPSHKVEDAPLRLETPLAVDPEPEIAPFHDEVALRALVGEMIREELQGELGARITRNVRKLIKREIDQALAAQKDT